MLELRLRFGVPSAHGATIGVGTRLYDGRRFSEGDSPPSGIDDVLSIRQSIDEFSVSLLGQVAWNGVVPDGSWHVVQVVQAGASHALLVDGRWIGAASAQSKVLRSMFLGNPLIARGTEAWTALDVDYIRIGVCRCRETDTGCP